MCRGIIALGMVGGLMIIKQPVTCDVQCLLCEKERAIVLVQIFDQSVIMNVVLCHKCIALPEHEITAKLLKSEKE